MQNPSRKPRAIVLGSLIYLLSFSFVGLLRAQTLPDCSTSVPAPLFPESVFPLGGFDFGLTLENFCESGETGPSFDWQLSKAGMNAIWFNYDDSRQARFAKQMHPSMGVYYAKTKDVLEQNWVGSRLYYPPGIDKRYFLATDQMGTAPTDRTQWSQLDIDRYAWAHNWPELKILTSPQGLSNNEWLVQKTLATNTAILELDQGTAVTALSVFRGPASDPTVNVTGAKIYCDFIYRLPDDNNQRANTTLYTFQYHVTDAVGMDVTPTSNAVPITWNIYKNYQNTSNEHANILVFPNQPRIPKQQYAVASLVIPLDPAGLGPGKTAWSVKIEVIANDPSADIMVRGFRVRSVWAQKLLTGQKDAALEEMFRTQVLNQMYNGDNITDPAVLAIQRAGAKKIKYITAGGELSSADGFRCLAYIDNMFHDYTLNRYVPPGAASPDHVGRHIYTFLASNIDNGMYAYYRTIYEDETTKLPPAIMEEGGLDFLTLNWENLTKNITRSWFPFPGDAMDYALKSSTNPPFEPFGMPITGMRDMTGHSWQHGSSSDNYPAFNNYESGWLDRYQVMLATQEFRPSSLAAFPPNSAKSEHGKWFAMPPTIMTLTFPQLIAGDSWFLRKANGSETSAATTMMENRKNCTLTNWLNAIRPSTTHPSTHNYFNNSYYDLFEPRDQQYLASGDWDNVFPRMYTRPLVATELRMYCWDALAYGAKGIFFNTESTDEGGNIGITNKRFEHNYDYDLAAVHPPLLGPSLGIGISTVFNSTTGRPDDRYGYTDHLVWNLNTCSLRWIPTVDAAGETIGWHKDGLTQISIADYINGLPLQDQDYFKDPNNSGPLSWVPFSVHRFCQEDWVASWRSSDNDGIYPTMLPETGGGFQDFFRGWSSTDYPYVHYNPSPGVPSNVGPCPWYNNQEFHGGNVGPCGMRDSLRPIAYEGFKERWLGATTVAKDLAPIALSLSRMDWISSVDFNLLSKGKGSVPEYIALWAALQGTGGYSPINLTSVITYKLDPYDTRLYRTVSQGEHIVDYVNNVLDPETSKPVGVFLTDNDQAPNDRRFLQLGYFNLGYSTDFVKKYAERVIVVNPRSWPMWREVNPLQQSTPIRQWDPTDIRYPTPAQLLGAVDARALTFTLNRSVIDPLQQFKFFDVYNFNTGFRMRREANQTYLVELDPGQGALLGIWPVMTLSMRNESDGLVVPPLNNGRHEAANETSGNTTQYFNTFASGGISVSYPFDTVMGATKRIEGTPIDSLIEPNIFAANPSIACSHESGKIGLVYAIDSAGPYHNMTAVIYRTASIATPYAFSTRDTLDMFLMAPKVLAAPSIAPTKDGHFWVGYRDVGLGGVIDLVDTAGTIIGGHNFSAGHPTKTKQISVACHEHPQSLPSGGYYVSGPNEGDTCYMAFEENSQIYYLKAYLNMTGGAHIDTAELRNMSRGLPWCENHDPQIHITQRRRATVTWDAVALTATGDEYTPTRSHYAVQRRRAQNGIWQNYTAFKGFDIKLTLGVIDTSSTLPVVAEADQPWLPSDTSWQDVQREVWNNPNDEVVHFAHYGIMAGNEIKPWQLAKLTSPSLEPSIPTRSMLTGVLQPMMYRFPKHIDTLPDELQMTSADFPYGTEADTASRFQTIIVHAGPAVCPSKVVAMAGPPTLHLPDTLHSLEWSGWTPSPLDTNVMHPIIWNDLSLRTQKFKVDSGNTISYDCYFRVGNYQLGDTTDAISQLLVNSHDTIRARIVLRSGVTNAPLQVLDWCMLDSAGFFQLGTLLDSGKATHTLNTSYSDSVYLTFEALHSISGAAEIDAMESYTNTVLDVVPTWAQTDSVSYKPTQPLPSHPIEATPLEIRAYPNPTRGAATAEVLHVEGVTTRIAVLDVLGKEIMHVYEGVPDADKLTLNINGTSLQSGSYFLRVISGNRVSTKRLMIVR
jgi:hypothetical protein